MRVEISMVIDIIDCSILCNFLIIMIIHSEHFERGNYHDHYLGYMHISIFSISDIFLIDRKMKFN